MDFRQIAFGQGPRNCERVFRAAISAFCTLERPTRHEVAQLDDLTLGLFDAVSADARRFAAAALCQCDPAPPGLVRRLCDEPLDIAAPLLVRSRALRDFDLIALIGQHGIEYARVIARRDNLNPVVASLIKLLIARAEASEVAETTAGDRQELQPDPLEEIRSQLRELMRNESAHGNREDRTAHEPHSQEHYHALRDTALAGDLDGLAAALGRALALSPEHIRNTMAGTSYSNLLIAFRALDLSPEQAFLLTVAAFPATQLTHLAAIRLFLERYRTVDSETARVTVASWRGDAAARERVESSYALQSAASAR